ncbi:MFS transporter permease [Geodermatophilus sp. DSM 45219]|uniref:MFS transporter permease n=1 Tax=Geodermatophilus sp. DSM 45219 TaxID=1881103 RepID=UPI00088B015F|nr:MFS transporter permease [Geodermatophilus sp. DSM 45219]SDO31812.1 hypothetical protein SAMN05428965_3506 [Geodermatophilus sp. DSM 45219]
MSTAVSPGAGATPAASPSPRARGLSGWWFRPVPLARIAVVRTIAYLFVPVDVFLTTAWIRAHADVPTEWYQPLTIGQLLPLPAPTPVVVAVVQWALVAAALAAATGRSPRLLGTAVFLLYVQWMVIGMSYGKVDHDRIGYLVLLAVLPTIGRVRWRDKRSSEAAGWAMAAVFVTVMLTYFLAAWAKLRFGGLDWATGSTLARAIVRRGTVLSDWTLDVPGLLVAAQWAMLVLEFAAPLMLLVWSARARVALVVFLLGFHLAVFASVKIIFLPHCVAILSILPWERLPGATRWLRARVGGATPAEVPRAGTAPPG